MNPAAAPRRFEGSYLGDAARLADSTRLECKICWHVYDPAEGCAVWQIPPGTPFAALPADWRCPVCDGAREQFMVLDGGTPVLPAAPCPLPAPAAPPDRHAPPAAAALERAFAEIHLTQMRGLPIVNEALQIRALGFRPWQGQWLGALVTPWFLNLVLLPGDGADWADLLPGGKELVAFPSGRYEFVHARRDGVGAYKACALISPMFDFAGMEQAVATAAAALDAIMDPANREEAAETAPAASPSAGIARPSPPSRRGLLLGRPGGGGDA